MRRVLLAVTLALFCAGPGPAAGQAPLEPRPALVPASAVVSAAQVYLACRWANHDVAAAQLRSFCSDLRLPDRLEETLGIGKQWSAVVLPTADIIAAAAVQEIQRRRQSAGALLEGFAPLAAPISFAEKSAVIRPGAAVIIDSMAAGLLRQLAADPTKIIRVRGTADARRQGDTNQDAVLAYQRALALREALAQRGVPLANLQPEYEVVPAETVLAGAERRAPRGAGAQAADAHLGLARSAGVYVERSTAAVAPNAGTSSISSLDAGSLALALTDALLERADRELQQYVLSSAAKRICERAKDLLEQTCRYFADNDGAMYLPSTTTLQSTIRSDVQRMPETALGMAWRVQFAGPLKYDDGARQRAFLAWYLLRTVDRVRRGEDPLQVVSGLHGWTLPALGPIQNPAKVQAVEFLQNFSRLSAVVDTARVQLRQAASGVVITPDTVLLYSLKSLAIQRPGITTSVAQFVDAWGSVEQHAETLRALRTSILAVRDSARARDRAVLYSEFLNTTAGLVLAVAERGLAVPDRMDFVTSFDNVRALTTAAGSGEYRVAIHRLADVLTDYQLVAGADQWGRCGTQTPVAPAPPAADGEPAAPIAAAAPAPPAAPVDDNCRRLPGLRVLSLVVDVSEAENEQDLNSAFRRFVGQGGSFRRKRQGTKWFAFANAYVGLGSGREAVELTAEEAADGGRRRSSQYISVSLPVGAEFGYPLGEGWSASVFVPVIDLGAIAGQRLGSDAKVEDEPTNRVSQFLSPGLYGVIGLPSIPVSVGIGQSWVPEARRAAGTNRTLDASRFGFFIAVDLPVFP